MLTTIETPIFQRMVRDVMDAVELSEFITFISTTPLAGDVIPGTGDLRKVRWSRSGMGKRRCARNLLQPLGRWCGGFSGCICQGKV